jgi:hypothetical protein
VASQHKRNVGPMQAAVRCGARTRAGTPCQAPMITGGKRCRMHGGKGSGAPRNNRNAFKTGLHTATMKDREREVRVVAQRVKTLIAEIDADLRLAKLAASDEQKNAIMDISPPDRSSFLAPSGQLPAPDTSSEVPTASRKGSSQGEFNFAPGPLTTARTLPPRASPATESDHLTCGDDTPVTRVTPPGGDRRAVFRGSFGRMISQAISLTRQDM